MNQPPVPNARMHVVARFCRPLVPYWMSGAIVLAVKSGWLAAVPW